MTKKQSEEIGICHGTISLSESGQVAAPNGSESDLKQKAQPEAAGVVMERSLVGTSCCVTNCCGSAGHSR
jgi:hypothetical protein